MQHGVTGDFITGETGQWAFSALGVGFNAAFYRATASGRRVQVVMQRGVRHYHDQTTRPLNDIRWETMTLLAHGAFGTMVDKTAYDGWLDPVFYERWERCSERLTRSPDTSAKPFLPMSASTSAIARGIRWPGKRRQVVARSAWRPQSVRLLAHTLGHRPG